MSFTFTARQLLTRSAQLVGMIAQNETLDAATAEDSLVLLNSLLDSFTTQDLVLPATGRDVFSYTDNVNTYLIGPGSTWNTDRPSEISYASVLSNTASPAFEIPMVVISDQVYFGITIKDLTAPFPFQLYYNATNLATGSIFVWPTPVDSANYSQVLYTPTQLTQFALLTTQVTMASGYYRMLYYNVGVEMGMAYGMPARPEVEARAMSSLKDVKRLNLQMVDLSSDRALPGLGGIYNVYGDVNY